MGCTGPCPGARRAGLQGEGEDGPVKANPRLNTRGKSSVPKANARQGFKAGHAPALAGGEQNRALDSRATEVSSPPLVPFSTVKPC